ncbi:hypothetical protein Tco_0133947, partial [Tanacetum coccineum]
MTTTAAQQVALDNALVAPENRMNKLSLSSKNLGTKVTLNLSLMWLLIKCTNHGEPLLQSSTSVYLGKSLVLIRSDSQEHKYYESDEFQVYGALLPEGMTNQQMRDSPAYKTYLAFATGAINSRNLLLLLRRKLL